MGTIALLLLIVLALGVAAVVCAMILAKIGSYFINQDDIVKPNKDEEKLT